MWWTKRKLPALPTQTLDDLRWELDYSLWYGLHQRERWLRRCETSGTPEQYRFAVRQVLEHSERAVR